MSIQRFDPGDIEVFTVQTSPSTQFSSSSLSGVTGSVYVYPRRSNAMKDYHVNWSALHGTPTGAFTQGNSVGDILGQARLATQDPALKTRLVREYLDVVGSQPGNSRNTQTVEVVRTTPGVNLDLDMTKKCLVTNVLMPEYRMVGTNYNFGFGNYNSLNFFTSSTVPSGSALLYPATTLPGTVGSLVSSSYVPAGAFSFDFWVNPRYTTDSETSEFKAGTVLHMSGAYALSIITGSSRDPNGLPDGFRVLLQLSSSATVKPSLVDPGTTTDPLVLVSDDNAVRRNTWQHVTVRWGTESYNHGSGSFLVDGVTRGTFCVPSSSVAPRVEPGVLEPCILSVGNFLECPETGEAAYFFSDVAQGRFGVPVSQPAFISASPGVDEPPTYSLSHPLNAEVHDLKIYNRYLSQGEISSLRGLGASPGDPNLLFYLPPMFTREAPYKTVDNQGGGGVLVHPFMAVNGTTTQPFNVDLSFDTGGHYINLENFTRDFATGNYPRLIELTGSALDGNTELRTANEFLYATGSVRKASLTVLPCDNGAFTPNYQGLLSSLDRRSFVTDHGDLAYNQVTLRNMYSLDSIWDLAGVTSGSKTLNTDLDPGNLIAALSGFDLSSSLGTLSPQRSPTILQRTRENGSLQVVLFDISSLFYGDRIKPGTLRLTDTTISGSGGKVGITLVDDGYGSLYRSSSLSVPAVGNCVGNVFYDHGMVLLEHPSLYWFGESGFECSFKGERNIHVQKFEMYANTLELVSSSNPTWKDSNLEDPTQRAVFITDLYVHDDNLNVIMRTKVATPVLKSASDKLKFVTKLDY